MVTAAVAAFCASGAQAADIAARPYTKAPPVQTVNWTGFYVGVSGGFGGNERDSVVSPNDASAEALFPSGGLGSTALGPMRLQPRGGFGGVQAGYNFQASQWLLGIETDFNFSDFKSTDSTSNFFLGIPAGAAELTTSNQLKWFGTVRARFGFLATSNLLLFGTGGLAYGKVDQAASYMSLLNILVQGNPPNAFSCFPNEPCFAGRRTTTEVGYTVGAGAEWLLWNNLSLKAEYSYINFGNSSYNISDTTPTGPTAASMRIATQLDYHIVRAGLNWHF